MPNAIWEDLFAPEKQPAELWAVFKAYIDYRAGHKCGEHIYRSVLHELMLSEGFSLGA